jgi:hypothetical protein
MALMLPVKCKLRVDHSLVLNKIKVSHDQPSSLVAKSIIIVVLFLLRQPTHFMLDVYADGRRDRLSVQLEAQPHLIFCHI